MTSSVLQRWFPTALESRPGSIRLVCIPFAGGGASVYRAWANILPSHVLLAPVQLKGREERAHEEPHTAISDIVSELAPVLAASADLPYVLFGYSMGALIAFELAHFLREANLPMPAALVLGARGAPQMPVMRKPIWDLPEDQFLARILELGGMSEEILRYPELLAFVMPALRADLKACDTYQSSQRPPLDVPVAVFGGLLDHNVPAGHLDAWQQHTSQLLTVELFPGGHFFLKENRDAMLRSLTRFLNLLPR